MASLGSTEALSELSLIASDVDMDLSAVQAYRTRRHDTFSTFRSADTQDSTQESSWQGSPATSYGFGTPASSTSMYFKSRDRSLSMASTNLLFDLPPPSILGFDDDDAPANEAGPHRPLSFVEQRFSRPPSQVNLVRVDQDASPSPTPITLSRPPTPSANRSRANSTLSLLLDGPSDPAGFTLRRARPKRFTTSPLLGTDVCCNEDDSSVANSSRRSMHRILPKFGRRPSEAADAALGALSAPMILPTSPDHLSQTSTTPKSHRRAHFDSLPHEVRIRIFKALVQIVAAGPSNKRSERWSRETKGLTALFTLACVSRTWLDLAFDGQLWSQIDLISFGRGALGRACLLRLATHAGAFMRQLHLRGMRELEPDDLIGLTTACSQASANLGQTRLTSLDLAGCTSLSAASLHVILSASPFLKRIVLRGLEVVDGHHIDEIYANTLQLIELDVSRCFRLSAKALIGSHACNAFPSLQTLKAAELKHMTDGVVTKLLERFRHLLVLDISYSPNLSDRAFADTRQAGRKLTITDLSLSGCKLLSDDAFRHLSGLMPRLCKLQAAQIGPNLADAGLIQLLRTTPLLSHLDLEGATGLTDRTLAALTPGKYSDATGTFLVHLAVSYCAAMTDPAIIRLIKRCTTLRVLEADNTRIGDAVPRAFVQIMRERRTSAAEIAIVDCRGLSKDLGESLAKSIRPRRGFHGRKWRELRYLESSVLDEFDSQRVVVHSYGTWQALDAASREMLRAQASRSVSGMRTLPPSSPSRCVTS